MIAVRIRHLFFVRISQIADADGAIGAPVPGPQMPANAALGGRGVRVVAVIQNPLLDIAEKVLHRIIVRTPLGQGGPTQVQRPHQPSRCLRLARVRGIAVEGHADRLPRIPTPHPPQELADELRSFARKEGPARLAVVHLIKCEQVKASARLLVAGQDQALLPRVPPPPIRLDRDRLDVEEYEDPAPGALAPLLPQAAEDGGPLGVVAQQFAADAPQAEPPFLSTRRKCSRLIAGTRRWRSR